MSTTYILVYIISPFDGSRDKLALFKEVLRLENQL